MLYGGNFLRDSRRWHASLQHHSARGMFRLSPCQTSAISPATFSTTRAETAGKNLEVASDYLAWSDLAAAFTKATGLPAIYQPITYPQWLAEHPWKDAPVAVDDPGGMSFADNFRAWWKLFEDDVCMRDMEFCRRLHPKLQDIETWIRAAGYDGRPKPLLNVCRCSCQKTRKCEGD